MQAEYTFQEIGHFPKIILDLISRAKEVQPFAESFYDLDAIEKEIERRKKIKIERNILADQLYLQNNTLKKNELVLKNIELLRNENTFTVTTGHQLNLLTGPLFSIYKIAQTIAITDQLNQKFPNNKFVPVFWMASEDHDFAEINHIHLFNRKIEWLKNDQENLVSGRIELNNTQQLFDSILDLFQDENQKAKVNSLLSIYIGSKNLADATRKLIHHLFGHYGLVICDGDDPKLKKIFSTVLQREIKEQITWQNVSATNQLLDRAGYHKQVHVRECNLFFIEDSGQRERIIFENGKYKIADKIVSTEELRAWAEKHPEKFSPNALLRPAYQELILPNLIYVGGGGEIAYWLQIKNNFQELGIHFPQLRVRDSLFIIAEKQIHELKENKLVLQDLEKTTDELMNDIMRDKHADKLDMSDAESLLMKTKSAVLEKVHQVDTSLNSMVEAEFSKMISALEKIESKLVKSQKQKDEVIRRRIEKLQDKLFPEGKFQERYENFLPYFLQDENFIVKVIQRLSEGQNPSVKLLIQ